METIFIIQELVDTVIYFLHKDTNTLRAASSINKTFHSACSRHIFQSITLTLQLDGQISRFSNLLKAAPRITKFVRRVCIRGDFDSPPNDDKSHDTHLSEILDALTLITSIEICHYHQCPSLFNRGKWENLPIALKVSLPPILLSPRLHELTFRNLSDIPFASLRLSANLNHLRLMRARFSTILDMTTPNVTPNPNIPPPRRPRLDSLTIFQIPPIEPSIVYFHDPHSPFDLSNLKTLNIVLNLSSPSHQSKLWEFILPLRTHIEHLGLRSFEMNTISLTNPLDFSQLTSLRSLHLVWTLSDWSSHDMTWMNHLLRTFSVPNKVEEVVLSIKLTSRELVHAMSEGAGRAEWDTLDETVRDAMFPALRVFGIHIHTPGPGLPDHELKAHVNLRMAHLRRRGILNVKSINALPVEIASVDGE